MIISTFSFVEIKSNFLIFIENFLLIAAFINQNFSSFTNLTKIPCVCKSLSSKVKLYIAHHVTILLNISDHVWFNTSVFHNDFIDNDFCTVVDFKVAKMILFIFKSTLTSGTNRGSFPVSRIIFIGSNKLLVKVRFLDVRQNVLNDGLDRSLTHMSIWFWDGS